jgi:hypothetical protein
MQLGFIAFPFRGHGIFFIFRILFFIQESIPNALMDKDFFFYLCKKFLFDEPHRII